MASHYGTALINRQDIHETVSGPSLKLLQCLCGFLLIWLYAFPSFTKNPL